MNDSPSLNQLKETHDSLYQRILATRTADSNLEKDIDQLLENINAISPSIRKLGDYLWLMNTSLQWQGVYATILKKPTLVQIPDPPDNLRGPPEPHLQDINSMTAQIAGVISLFRRGKEAERKMNAPSIQEDIDADSHQAQVYICLEFLTGKRDFVREALPGSYECLENVWLQDVIQLKAYQNWRARGAPEESTAEQAKGDYYDACKFFQDRVEDQKLKETYVKDEFDTVFEYLLRYLEKDQRSLAEPAIKQLIERKAGRYSSARMKKTEHENLRDAEAFVRKFYGNITGAIMQEDPTSIAEISAAIAWSEGKDSRMEIMNSFEAAICIYFLKGFKKAPEGWKTQPA